MSRPRKLGYDEIKNSSERHISHDSGKQLLTEIMNSGEVASPDAKLSLKCALGGKRVKDPVRSIHCLPHLKCFDLRGYFDYHNKSVLLNGQAKAPQRICPVCMQAALVDDLRIDYYFAHILESVPIGVDEVQLLPDGSFRVAAEEHEPAVTVHDSDPVDSHSEEPPARPSTARGDVSELLKRSKAFQRTLLTFRTKKNLTDDVQDFLENHREELGSLLRKLASTDQNTAATRPIDGRGPASVLAADQADARLDQEEPSNTYETVAEALHCGASSTLAHVEPHALPTAIGRVSHEQIVSLAAGPSEPQNARKRRDVEPKANGDLRALRVTSSARGKKRHKNCTSTTSNRKITRGSSKLAWYQSEKRPAADHFDLPQGFPSAPVTKVPEVPPPVKQVEKISVAEYKSQRGTTTSTSGTPQSTMSTDLSSSPRARPTQPARRQPFTPTIADTSAFTVPLEGTVPASLEDLKKRILTTTSGTYLGTSPSKEPVDSPSMSMTATADSTTGEPTPSGSAARSAGSTENNVVSRTTPTPTEPRPAPIRDVSASRGQRLSLEDRLKTVFGLDVKDKAQPPPEPPARRFSKRKFEDRSREAVPPPRLLPTCPIPAVHQLNADNAQVGPGLQSAGRR